MWSNPVFTSFLGIFSGVFVTFLGTSLNNWRQERKEKKQRRQWLIYILPLLLNENLEDVRNAKEAKYSSWMSKLLTEGYDNELQYLAEQQNNQDKLIEILFDIDRDLRNYENARLNDWLNEKIKSELEEEISEAITLLKQIAAKEKRPKITF